MTSKFVLNKAGNRHLKDSIFIEEWQKSDTKNDFERRLTTLIEEDARQRKMSKCDFNRVVTYAKALVGLYSTEDLVQAHWHGIPKDSTDDFKAAVKAFYDLSQYLGNGWYENYLAVGYSNYETQIDRARKMKKEGYTALKDLKRVSTTAIQAKARIERLNEYAKTFLK